MHPQRIILLIMVFVLPFWLTIGRALFGSIGWLMFIYLFIIAPILFILLLTIFLLRIRTPWNTFDTVTHWLLYGSVLLHGFFVTDFGDTEDSVVSVFSNLFGRHLADVSGLAAFAFLIMSVLLLTTVLVRAIVARIQVMRKVSDTQTTER